MKITLYKIGASYMLTVEKPPMAPARFNAVCALAMTAITGAVFVATVYVVGFWAVPWGVGLIGFGALLRVIKEG